MDKFSIGPEVQRHPGSTVEMFDEWQAWQRVVGALETAACRIDINEEPLLAAAIELWGETLVRLRLTQPADLRDRALDDKIVAYNARL